jgi:hypothetical protein
MVSLDRETCMIVGLIVCVLGVLYLHREQQKQKKDLDMFVERLNTASAPVREAPPKKQPVARKQQIEETSEEINDENS